MQSSRHVHIVVGGDDGTSGRTLGLAEVISSDVVVMRLGDREPIPTLPLHAVLVPAAAGGGRDEHIPVAEVILPDGEISCVALRLGRPLPAADGSSSVTTLSMSSKHIGRVAEAGGGVHAKDNPWYCKVFPQFCR
ncbi:MULTISPECIES: hypothetical protein [unclassified Serinicoccus]|uniref:hypothetical protein n=1 Tax=unclassified Serinicoccus TaxID=2643101 RepID=UPI0038545C4D